MLHKPLFIIHVVKGLLKSYTEVRKQSTGYLNYKNGHSTCISIFYKNARFQVSMQINEVLLYNKSQHTKNLKFKKEVSQ